MWRLVWEALLWTLLVKCWFKTWAHISEAHSGLLTDSSWPAAALFLSCECLKSPKGWWFPGVCCREDFEEDCSSCVCPLSPEESPAPVDLPESGIRRLWVPNISHESSSWLYPRTSHFLSVVCRIFTAIMPMVAAGLISDDPTLMPIRRLVSFVWAFYMYSFVGSNAHRGSQKHKWMKYFEPVCFKCSGSFFKLSVVYDAEKWIAVFLAWHLEINSDSPFLETFTKTFL